MRTSSGHLPGKLPLGPVGFAGSARDERERTYGIVAGEHGPIALFDW